MKTSKDDESTKYSQSPCDVAGSSARFLQKPCFYILACAVCKNINKSDYPKHFLYDTVIHRY